MFTQKPNLRRLVMVSAVSLCAWPLAQAAENGKYDIGEPVTQQQIAGWNIDISPSGDNLPKGKGSVAEGEKIYANKCASCHGDKGQGKPMDKLVGGQGTLASDKPVKTIGSYWPYATTVYDYVHRAMPFNNPQSLKPDEVYAVTAYLLHLNDILPADATLDQDSLPKVEMPNRDGFFPDPRPDTNNTPCMDCK